MHATHRRDLLGQIDILGDGGFALLNGAVQIDILDLFAEVCCCVDKPDQPIFDLKYDIGPFLDVLDECAGGLNGQFLATVGLLATS
jgi:hypothetical protein